MAYMIIRIGQEDNIDPYNTELDIEGFLAEYRIRYAADHYASKRYFNDFITTRVFIEGSDGAFKVNYERANKRLGITFPEPNKGAEKPSSN